MSFDEGLTLRDKIGAVAFFEVSTKDNVDAVLQAMIESAVASKIKEDEPKGANFVCMQKIPQKFLSFITS